MRKALRITSLITVLLLGILIILYAYIRIKFPPDKVQTLILEQIRESIHREITATSLRIHPLSGFELHDLVVYDTARSPRQAFLTVKSVHLNYRLWSIFKKKIEIKKIEVVKPRLFLRRSCEGSWNFEDLISLSANSPAGSAPVSREPKVPGIVKKISLRLREFSVRDAGLDAEIVDSLGDASAEVGPVSVQLDHFVLKKLNPETIFKNLSLQLSVYSKRGKIQLVVVPAEVVSLPKFSLKKIVASGEWTLRAGLRTREEPDSTKSDSTAVQSLLIHLASAFHLKPMAVHLFGNRASPADSLVRLVNYLPDFRSGMQGVIAPEALSVRFFDIRATVGSFLRTAFRISADSLSGTPNVKVSCQQGIINLAELSAYLKKLPLLGDNPLKSIQLSGTIDFSNLRARATSTENRLNGSYRVQPVLQHLSVVIPEIEARVTDFSAKLLAIGQVRNSTFVRGNVEASFVLPSLFVAPAESLEISGKNIVGDSHVSLGRNLVPKKLSFMFSADSLLGAQISSYSEFTVAPVPSLRNLKISDFNGSTQIQIQALNMGSLSGGSAQGHISASGLLVASYGMNAFVQTTVHSEDLKYLYAPGVFESLPEINFTGKGNLKSSPGFQKVFLNDFRLALNDFVEGVVQATIEPLQQKADIQLEELSVDLSKVRPFLPSDIQETLQFADWNGEMNIQAKAQAALNPETDSLMLAIKGRTTVAVPYFIDSEMLLNVNDFALQADFGGVPDNLNARFQGDVRSAFLRDVLAGPIKNTHFEGQVAIRNLDWIHLKNFSLKQPDLHADVRASGDVTHLSETFPRLNIVGNFRVRSYQPFSTLVGIAMSGNLTGDFRVKTDSLNPKNVFAGGAITLKGFNVAIENTAKIRGIRGKIPFRMGLDIERSLLISSRQDVPISLSLYPVFQPYYFRSDSLFQTIGVDTISVLNYTLTNLRSDIRVENGRILLPNTRINLYDGNLVSQMWLNLGTGQLRDISYEIRAQVARVNSAKFPGSRNRKKKQSQIAASLHFEGKGLDLAKGLDVQGGVEVTEIGPATTDNLLRSLDPQGLDKSIQQVRQLIRFGAKPKLISFRIRHGNLYPTILLSQPWYYPFKISGGKVSLVRIPLSFAINMALQTSEPIQ